ncbi:MAG: gliding motility-associated C-terminal domain-containing protein [Flavobacteriales bacterium]|nr:gliding motility-associated C-terminal domain-containing protein [Flavobacteriales bacterium]
MLFSFGQNNILIIDYNNAFSSDQSNNNSIIYNRLVATQGTVNRVASIPAAISNATYDQVWIFGNMGITTATILNPIVNFMNGGGGVYIQSEVSCCNNQAAFVDALIDATVTVGGSVTHTTTMSGYYETIPDNSGCTPPTWVTYGAALRPFQGTPVVNMLLVATNTCGGAITAGTAVGVKFRSCDMISGQGALVSIGDFNVFPSAGTCGSVGILGTPNDNNVIDYVANIFPSLLTCSTPSAPTMTTPPNDTICAGANVPASNYVSNPAGGTFAWTNSNTAIGLAASGNGNTPAFTATNPTSAPITSTITVTPTVNGCPGTPITYTITVNPTPTMTTPANITACNGDAIAASAFVSNPAGGTFTWTNSNTAIGLAASGSGNTPAFTATNATSAPITSTVTVTPTVNGCIGNPINYTITVNPTPTVTVPANASYCIGDLVPASSFTSTPAGGTFTWTNSSTAIGLAASGNGNTPAFTAGNGTGTITVTPTANGCVGTPSSYTITVNNCGGPIASFSSSDSTLCLNDCIDFFDLSINNPTSWTWSFPGGNPASSTAQNPTNICYNTSGSYDVQLIVSNGTISDTLLMPNFITVNTALSTTMSATDVTCNAACDGQAGVTVAGGTAPYTYSWSNSATTPNISNLCPGLYTVTITDAIGCTIVDDTTITEPPVLQVTLTSSADPLCNGSCDGQIVVAGNGGTPNYQFSSDGVTFQASGTFNNLCAGNYTITIMDANNCTSTINVVLNDPALLVINSVTPTDVSCNFQTTGNNSNGTITINASGGTPGLTYSINNGATFSPSNTFTGLSTGVYTVVVKDANGCTANGGVFNINEPTAISIPNVITDASCYGFNDGQIVIAPQGGTPNYSYSWTAPGVGNTPVANGLYAGSVTVTVTDANGCSQDSTFQITEPGPVNYLVFEADTLQGCAPLEVTFTNLTDPNAFTAISWNLAVGSSSSSPTTVTYTSPGSYDISLTITDTNGCQGTLTKNAYITVFDNPTAHYTTENNPTTVFDPTVLFFDQSFFNIVAWDWNFGGLGFSNDQNPLFTFPEDTGKYPVTLIVTDNHGCKDTVSYLAIIEGEYGIFVPNSFTPDFDGLNDGFAPNGFGIADTDYGFYIFDRWGELIFESHDKYEPWYGDYKGKLVQAGTYVWKLHCRDVNGDEHEKVGHVNIIR